MVPAPISWSRKFTHTLNLNGAMRLTSHSAKKQVTDQGGKIEHEFKLVKGFTYVIRSKILSLYTEHRLTCTVPHSPKTRSTLCPPTSTSTSRTTARSPPSKSRKT